MATLGPLSLASKKKKNKNKKTYLGKRKKNNLKNLQIINSQ